MIFAHRVPHEHGVEGGDLVDPHPRHPNDLRHVVHGGDWQPASVLPLSEVKERDNLLKCYKLQHKIQMGQIFLQQLSDDHRDRWT